MEDIKKLVAYEEIKMQLYRYCKGIDKGDLSLVRSCFAVGHQHRHTPFSGTLDEFIAFVSKNLTIITRSQHSISNVIIDIADDGLSAVTEANFTAVHLIEPNSEVSLSFPTGDGNADWTVAGFYRDRWVCQDGKWLIIERDAGHTWDQLVPADIRPS